MKFWYPICLVLMVLATISSCDDKPAWASLSAEPVEIDTEHQEFMTNCHAVGGFLTDYRGDSVCVVGKPDFAEDWEYEPPEEEDSDSE